MLEHCKNLNDLWECVHELNKRHFPENELMPILGNGKINHPKIMFVFINPTARNSSSQKDWRGPRFPFIGTKQIWRIFFRAGLLEEELMSYIEKNKDWSLDFTNKLLCTLQEKSLYITNIVKWTGEDATLPNQEKINLFLPILKKEIELVQPEKIMTFGLIPFEALTKRKIKLKDYYTTAIKQRKLEAIDVQINNFKTKILACYFPVGRGDPKKAVELLKLIEK